MDLLLELVLFAAVLYWIWPNLFAQGASRISKMVDVISNRMFDTFNKFAPNDMQRNETVATIGALKRFANEQRNQRIESRKLDTKFRDAKLYDIKECQPQVMLGRNRPLTGLTCTGCTPTSRDSFYNSTTANLGLKNILQDHPLVSDDKFLHRLFPDLVQSFGSKRIHYKQVSGSVLDDERVRRAVEQTARRQIDESGGSPEDGSLYGRYVAAQTARARRILRDLRSTSSDFLFKCTSWILYKILPCFLSSVVVHLGQVDMLRRANASGLPLIFLPLHRSHLDYVMISFILQNNGIPCPLIAAGDNLKIPVFGTLLRGLGAFYIKRRMDSSAGQSDRVYKAILHSYMTAGLKAGHNLEFFMEGGRTRTGKPLMPKYGIFSIVVDAFMTGAIDDALVVPVSISYEKIVDGNFVREQLGQPKQMESFGSAIKAIWRVLKSDYGMARIDCNQPFSFRELVETFNKNSKVQNEMTLQDRKKLKSNNSLSSLYGTDIVLGEYHNLVEKMTKHIMYDCVRSSSIMSTNATAFLLLHKFRKGATLSRIADGLDELRRSLETRDRDCGFTGKSIDVILHSLDILGSNLVKKHIQDEDVLIKPSVELAHIIELSYYSNIVTTLYALDSAVALALASLGAVPGVSLNEEDLVEASKDICNVLQYEYIFHRPCEDLNAAVIDAIENLKIFGDVFVSVNESEQVVQSRQLAERLFEDEDEPFRPNKLTITDSEKAMESIHFLAGVLAPLIESYSITAQCLDGLVGRQVLETDFVKTVLDAMMLQLDEGLIIYGESISSDSIKNALKLFQKWDVLESHNESKMKLYYLKEEYDSHEAVKDVYDRVNRYRIGL